MHHIWNTGKVHRGLSLGELRKRPLERPKRIWQDSIKMDLKEVRWEGMDLIYLAQDRDRWRTVVNAVTNLRVP
jgi:hypothetical protein